MPEDRWIKSSLSYANCNCVKIRTTADGQVAVRNSRFPDVQLPPFTPDEWNAFVAGVHAGEFETSDCSDQ
jgi:hypothetical protein